MFETFKVMVREAWAFIVDPEARTNSDFYFPSGNPMSVREARKRGLIKGEVNTPIKISDILLIFLCLGIVFLSFFVAVLYFLEKIS